MSRFHIRDRASQEVVGPRYGSLARAYDAACRMIEDAGGMIIRTGRSADSIVLIGRAGGFDIAFLIEPV